MKFLLDSNVLIAIGLNSDRRLVERAGNCDAGDLAMSAISYAEIAHGSERGKPPPLDSLDIMAEEIPVLPFDDKAARVYARLPFKRASYDRLIAAHAMSLGLVLVTSNVKHFADVPGLQVENWIL